MVAVHASIRYEKKTRASTRGGNISGSGTVEDASGINWLRNGPAMRTGPVKENILHSKTRHNSLHSRLIV